jgi:hypothetical protein
VAEKLEALARAVGQPSAAALLNTGGPNGCIGDVVEHGYRAVIRVSRSCEFTIHLYRCGRENMGAVRFRTAIFDLEVARAAALELCEVESRKSAQLDLFSP